jgi:hypothetical protein
LSSVASVKPVTRIVQGVFLLGCLGVVAIGVRKIVRHLRHESAVHAAALPAERIDAKALVTHHPRLLLDDAALGRLRDAAKHDTWAWQRVHRLCETQSAQTIESGYQGFDWTDAVADLALCWRATGERAYAERAVFYLAALLDDRLKVGDGAGGDEVVRHDDGYGIRNFAVGAALGYDWLYDAPGMTKQLRARIVARETAWLGWYAKKGYLRDTPISNYFVGWLTAITFAALAIGDDATEGAAWLTTARDDLLGKLLLPALRAWQAGGDWSEGWQYGELVAAEVALVACAYRTATGVDLADKLPWIADVVTHHVHALQPGGTVYDGGTWGEWPTTASALALDAAPLVLDGHDETRAAEARWMAHNLLKESDGRAWIALLSERDGAKEIDPRTTEPLGHRSAGTGLVLLRSAWSADATWVSLQVGPRHAVDHQHLDQGHFEIWRGADPLFVDGGPDEGDATINHDTLLVDDGKKLDTYAPNQGVWGWDVQPAVLADDGAVAVARGDFADAYAPKCKEDGCKDRSITQAERTLVFVRPSLVVIADRVKVKEGKIGVTWIAHAQVAPSAEKDHASVIVGGSRADVTTIAPAQSTISVVKEPTGSASGVYEANHPRAGGMWRLEVTTPTGSKDRTIYQWITVDAASASNTNTASTPTAIGDDGASGIVGGKRVAVLAPSARTTTLPHGTALAVLLGLDAGAHYTIAAKGCAIDVAKDDHGTQTASEAGSIVISKVECQ